MVSTSNTQAILEYQAPSNAPCTVEVSESESYKPLVFDVDPARFAGSSLDSRPGSFAVGGKRRVVIGKRTIESDESDKKRSRALAAATKHYARVRCGADAASVAFSTTTIPYGSTRPPDTPDTPEHDYTNHDETLIDPQTGAKLKRLTHPDFFSSTRADRPVAACAGAGWSAPDACVADDKLSAEHSGPSVQALRVTLNTHAGWDDPTMYQLASLTVKMKASVEGAANRDDRVLRACLSADGEKCATPEKEIDLGTCSATAVRGDCAGFGSVTPVDYWGAPHRVFGVDPQHNPALLLRPKTARDGRRIAVQHLTYTLMAATTPGIHAGPSSVMCSPVAASDNGDGNTYRLCYSPSQGSRAILSWDETRGKSYRLAPLYLSAEQAEGEQGTPTEVIFDTTNPRVIYTIHNGTNALFKGTFSSRAGTLSTNFTGHQYSNPPSLTWTPLTPMSAGGLRGMLASFEPRFDREWHAKAGKSRVWLDAIQAGRLVFHLSAVQDTGGWVGVFDPGAPPPPGCKDCRGAVIAARRVGGTPADRYCGIHAVNQTPFDQPAIDVGTSRTLATAGTSYFEGPWRVRVRKPGGGALGPSDTVFEVMLTDGTYEPVDPTPSGGDNDLVQTARPGDLFAFNKNSDAYLVQPDELMEIVSIDRKSRPHVWTMRRGNHLDESPFLAGNAFGLKSGYTSVYPIPENSPLYAVCRTRPLASTYGYEGGYLWRFLDDPRGTQFIQPGTQAESPTTLRHRNTGSHADTKRSGRPGFTVVADTGEWCTPEPGCYGIQYAPTTDVWNRPLDFQSAKEPPFAGVKLGGAYEHHATQHGGNNRALDIAPLITAVGESAEKPEWGTTSVYKMKGVTLHRKIAPTHAQSGARMLTDVSSPRTGDIVTDETPWTYCVAERAGECRAGSAANDIFVVVPGRQTRGCGETVGRGGIDVCVFDRGAYAFGVMEFPTDAWSRKGELQRVISVPFPVPHFQSVYSTARAVSNGKWILTPGGGQRRGELYMIETPPEPKVDGVRRDTFVPVMVKVAGAAAGEKALVEFGYAEYGMPAEFRCSTRVEACVAESQRVDEKDPFAWASEKPAGMACPKGCEIAVPGLSGRVVYYRVVYRGAGVRRGEMQAEMVP